MYFQQNIARMENLYSYWWVIIVIIILFASFKTINQGYVGVVTMFGKYRRVLTPGLSLLVPLLEQVTKRVSIQNRSVEMEFQAVASNNLKAAAENEGQALLITKTKGAEAEGNAIKIAAEAERLAAQLRGQGVALFREEVAKGMSQAAEQMKQANLDTNVILFSMWTEAIKNFAELGRGNVIFLDGSSEGMEKTMRQIMAMQHMDNKTKTI